MTTTTSESLEAAASIANRLTTTAIWHRGRCNWVTPTPDAYEALPADLYHGTAGVGLFLAEAAIALDDQRLAKTARGAIGHALAHAGRDEGGLYVGPLGVVLAASRIAHVLDDDALNAKARRVLVTWRRTEPSDNPDLLGGWAGVICALLALPDDVAVPWLVAAASERGDRLLASPNRTRDGWSWSVPGQRGMTPLCNLAHGTAGIGLALLELFAVTGDTRYRAAAEKAFDYERTWWQRAGGAWPDLRGVGQRAASDAPVPVMAAWCHGAPGGLLARLRCAQLSSGPYQEEAELALAQTREIAAGLVAQGIADPCLCHGAAGIGDALLYAGDDSAPLAELIRASGATRPDLFTGLAGVGLFHLRLADPAIPTPLIVHRSGSLDRNDEDT